MFIRPVLMALILVVWSGRSGLAEALWLEAESAAVYAPLLVKSDPEASGQLFIASWKPPEAQTQAEGQLVFTLQIQTAGTYHIWGRGRFGLAHSPYQVQLRAVEPVVQPEAVWQDWQQPEPQPDWHWVSAGLSFALQPGKYTLTLRQQAGGSAVALDKILLTRQADFSPQGLGEASRQSRLAPAVWRSSQAVSRHGQLRLAGTQVVNQRGEAVQLRGISTHGLQWFPLVPGQTLPHLGELFDLELVRLAMYVEAYAPPPYAPDDYWGGYLADSETMLQRLEQAIEDAIRADLYVMVDWHIHSNPSLHTAEAVAFFKYIAQKYAHSPHLIYEICNEPVDADWEKDIRPFAEAVIQVIREAGAQNLIVVGTPRWSQELDQAVAAPLSGENLMYALHYYSGSHDRPEMQQKILRALDAGLAVFVSEWGASDVGMQHLNLPEAEQWLAFLQAHQLSWVFWSLGNKDEPASVLTPAAAMGGPWLPTDLSPVGRWLRATGFAEP